MTIFFNHCFDKRRFNSFLHWFFKKSHPGKLRLLKFLEKLKILGFHSATQAGFSISIDDLKVPLSKSTILLTAERATLDAHLQLTSGNLTKIEQYQRIIEIWNRTSEKLKDQVIQSFQISDFFNPVYLMAFSGARGNISQIRQLVGMRGLMADPQGKIIDFPIRSNFREGLTLTEYLISCSGARKGIVDTALRTAASGYLTRRLVDVAHHVIISQIDCQINKIIEGIFLKDLYDKQKKVLSLQQRLVGRILAETIISSKTSLIIGKKNQEISKKTSQKICENRTKVLIRSPLTCQSSKFICQLCYGWNLAEGQLVSVGEAVGILAAQSIGEPGTQMTMRTFHTGGVFMGTLIDQTYTPFSGDIFYSAPCNGLLIRTRQGKIAYLSKNSGILSVRQKGANKILRYQKAPTFITSQFNILLKNSTPLNQQTLRYQLKKLSFQLKKVIFFNKSWLRVNRNLSTHQRPPGQLAWAARRYCPPRRGVQGVGMLRLEWLHGSAAIPPGGSSHPFGHLVGRPSGSAAPQGQFRRGASLVALPGHQFTANFISNIFQIPKIGDRQKVQNRKSKTKQVRFVFQSFTLLYVRQGEHVVKAQLIAERSFFENVASDAALENEQEIVSPESGEIYFENMIFLEKTILKNEIKLIKNYVQGLGQFWILFGQPFRNVLITKKASFFKRSDLIDKLVPFSQISIEPTTFLENHYNFLQLEQRKVFLEKVDHKRCLFFEHWEAALTTVRAAVGRPYGSSQSLHKVQRCSEIGRAARRSPYPFGEQSSSFIFPKYSKHFSVQMLFFKNLGYLQVPENHVFRKTIRTAKKCDRILWNNRKAFTDAKNFQTWMVGLQSHSKYIDSNYKIFPIFQKNFQVYFFQKTFEKNYSKILKYRLMNTYSSEREFFLSDTSLISSKFFCEFQKIQKNWVFHENTCLFLLNRQGLFHSEDISDVASNINSKVQIGISFSVGLQGSKFSKFRKFLEQYGDLVGAALRCSPGWGAAQAVIRSPSDGRGAARGSSAELLPNQVSPGWGAPQATSKICFWSFSFSSSKPQILIKSLFSLLFFKKSRLFQNRPKNWRRQTIKVQPIIIHWQSLPTYKYIFLINFLKSLSLLKNNNTVQYKTTACQGKFIDSLLLHKNKQYNFWRKKKEIWKNLKIGLYSFVRVFFCFEISDFWSFQHVIDLAIIKNNFSLSYKSYRLHSLILSIRAPLLKNWHIKNFFNDRIIQVLNGQELPARGDLVGRPGRLLQGSSPGPFPALAAPQLHSLPFVQLSLLHPTSSLLVQAMEYSNFLLEGFFKIYLFFKPINKVFRSNFGECKEVGRPSGCYGDLHAAGSGAVTFWPAGWYGSTEVLQTHRAPLRGWSAAPPSQPSLREVAANLVSPGREAALQFQQLWLSGLNRHIFYKKFKHNFQNIHFQGGVNEIFPTSFQWKFFGDCSIIQKQYPTYSKNLIKNNKARKKEIQSCKIFPSFNNIQSQIAATSIFLLEKICPQSLISSDIKLSNKTFRISSKLQKWTLNFYFDSYFFILQNFFLIKNFETRFFQSLPKEPIMFCFSKSKYPSLAPNWLQNEIVSKYFDGKKYSRNVESNKSYQLVLDSRDSMAPRRGGITFQDFFQYEHIEYISKKSYRFNDGVVKNLKKYSTRYLKSQIISKKFCPDHVSSHTLWKVHSDNLILFLLQKLEGCSPTWSAAEQHRGSLEQRGDLLGAAPSLPGSEAAAEHKFRCFVFNLSEKNFENFYSISLFSSHLLPRQNRKLFRVSSSRTILQPKLCFKLFVIIQMFLSSFQNFKTAGNLGGWEAAPQPSGSLGCSAAWGSSFGWYAAPPSQPSLRLSLREEAAQAAYYSKKYRSYVKNVLSSSYFVFDQKLQLLLISSIPILSYSHSGNALKAIYEKTLSLKIHITKTKCNNFLFQHKLQTFQIIKKNYFRSFEIQIFIRFFLPFSFGEIIDPGKTWAARRSSRSAAVLLLTDIKDFFSSNRGLEGGWRPGRGCTSVQPWPRSSGWGPQGDLLEVRQSLRSPMGGEQLAAPYQVTLPAKSKRYWKYEIIYRKMEKNQKLCLAHLPLTRSASLPPVLGSFVRSGKILDSQQLTLNAGQLIAKTQQTFLFRKASTYLLNNQSILHIKHGDIILKNQRLCSVFYHQSKTGDIVQGIPKIEEIFEARKTSKSHQFRIFSKDFFFFQKKMKQYLQSLQKSIVNNIQRIYCGQGIHISDKHIEIIVRQMTSNVCILEPGQTGLLCGEILALQWVYRINSLFISNQVIYEPILLGMTKTCLETSSFLSAASFQETTRILSRAALQNQIDFIRGLKQNVILGHLVPIGTGCF